MKRLITFVILMVFCSGLYAQGWFDTNNFGVGLYNYGQVELYGTITETDTIYQIDRQTILVEQDSEHVFAYREDADNEDAPITVESPAMGDYELYGSINNYYSFEPPNVIVKHNIYGWDDGGYALFKYTVINNDTEPLDARIGFEVIPYINGEYGFETVEYIPDEEVFTLYKTDHYIGYKFLSHPLASLNTIAWYSGYDSTDMNLSGYMEPAGSFDTLFVSESSDGTVVFPSTGQVTIAGEDSVMFYMGAAYATDEATVVDYLDMAQSKYQTTDIEAGENAALPARASLAQNYPNPFNPQTTIRYQIPEQNRVKISVCNTRGELVETLVNQEMTAGEHQVTFQGRNHPSGLYFYTIQAGDVQLTRKMLLVK